MTNASHQASPTGEMRVRPLTVEVGSFTTPYKTYVVQLPHCTCLDFLHRDVRDENEEPHLCKHIRAALARMASWRPAA